MRCPCRWTSWPRTGRCRCRRGLGHHAAGPSRRGRPAHLTGLRSEIARRAGLAADDQTFAQRFDLLVRAGALQGVRGEKKHQVRYLPDPDALLSAELLARLDERGGAEQLHALLVSVAETIELAFETDPDRDPPRPEDVRALMRKLSAVLHAYAARMEAAVTSGTFREMVAARTGDATTRHMAQITRITRAVNRDGSPYQQLFHSANQLLAAGQRYVEACERLTDRLVEVAVSADEGGLLALLSPEQCLAAAINRDQRQLAQVGADVPLDGGGPLVHLADLQEAAATMAAAPPPRTVPTPPAEPPDHDPLAPLADRQRRRQARRAVRQQWAERVLAGDGEVDLTDHATTWPHAAKLLADLMALSRDPRVPLAADVGDPPLVEPDAEVPVRHPLRLRRLGGAGLADAPGIGCRDGEDRRGRVRRGAEADGGQARRDAEPDGAAAHHDEEARR